MHVHNLRVTSIITLRHNNDKNDVAKKFGMSEDQKHKSKQWPYVKGCLHLR